MLKSEGFRDHWLRTKEDIEEVLQERTKILKAQLEAWYNHGWIDAELELELNPPQDLCDKCGYPSIRRDLGRGECEFWCPVCEGERERKYYVEQLNKATDRTQFWRQKYDELRNEVLRIGKKSKEA
jgi:hypothetical protein